jgi:hypothetical protein
VVGKKMPKPEPLVHTPDLHGEGKDEGPGKGKGKVKG